MPDAHHGRGPRHRHRRLDALGAPEGEVDEAQVSRRQAAAGRLRRDRRGERQLVEQVGLGHLGLGNRRRHLEKRLTGEHHPPLGHGPHVTGEAQPGDGLDGQVVEIETGEGVEVVVVDGEPLQEFEAALETARHEEAALRREVAHEQTERGGRVHASAAEAGRHPQLIEIGEERPTHWSDAEV